MQPTSRQIQTWVRHNQRLLEKITDITQKGQINQNIYQVIRKRQGGRFNRHKQRNRYNTERLDQSESRVADLTEIEILDQKSDIMRKSDRYITEREEQVDILEILEQKSEIRSESNRYITER